MEANLHLHRLTSDIQLVNVLKFLLNGGKSTLDRRPHILAVFCIDNRAPGLLVRNYGERHSNWKLFLFFQLFKNDPSQINACNDASLPSPNPPDPAAVSRNGHGEAMPRR